MILSRERFSIKLERQEKESLRINMLSERYFHKEEIQTKLMILKKDLKCVKEI
jgi:hypothetical protein